MAEESNESFLGKIADTVANGLRPRIEDPFLGVYTISFLIWNYQIFLYVFSSMDPWLKYQNIHRSFNFWSFCAPAISVILLNFIFPKYLKRYYTQSEEFKISLSSELNKVRAEHITMSVITADLKDKIDFLQKENAEYILKLNQSEFKNSKLTEEAANAYAEEKEQLKKQHQNDIREWEQRFKAILTELDKEKARTLDIEGKLGTTILTNTNGVAIDRTITIADYLKERALDDAYEELFEKITTTTRYYLSSAPKKETTIFLTKGLLKYTGSSENFENDCLDVTDLGKMVYEALIDGKLDS